MGHNLRIVLDNAADRGLLSSSNAYPILPVANLRTDLKSEVWRALGINGYITLEWPGGELVSCVHLPFCNFTSGATMRVRGWQYANSDPVLDTGHRPCAQYTPLDLWGWGQQALGVNAYAFGGGAYAGLWFEPVAVNRLQVDIVDLYQPQGYLEAARLIVGMHWSPRWNAVYGAAWQMVEATRAERSEGGDRRAMPKPKHRKLQIDLARLPPADRATIMGVCRTHGLARPFFLSLFPDKGEDADAEQNYQVWGALENQPPVVHPAFEAFATQLTIEEM